MTSRPGDLVAITCAMCQSTTSKHRLAWIRVDQGGKSAALCSWACALRFVRLLRLAEDLINDDLGLPPRWREILDGIDPEWLRALGCPDPEPPA